MKKYMIMLMILALAGPALARDETLLGDDLENGGYGALVVKYGPIMGTEGFFVGGQGGWVINHTLVIGGGGYGLVSRIVLDDGECSNLGFGYGGLFLEYIIASHKLVHFSIQTLIGGGGVGRYSDWDCGEWGCGDDYWRDSDAFFALEPGANLMLNLHKFVRVGFGATYRFVDGVSYLGLCDSDLSGATGQFIVKFGSF